jgi:hypothetical protein
MRGTHPLATFHRSITEEISDDLLALAPSRRESEVASTSKGSSCWSLESFWPSRRESEVAKTSKGSSTCPSDSESSRPWRGVYREGVFVDQLSAMVAPCGPGAEKPEKRRARVLAAALFSKFR